MELLFNKDYWPLWAFVLGLALFFPVRQLIWVLYVRRAERGGSIEEGERRRLKRRAGATSGLICFLFAIVYTQHLFSGQP